MIRKNRLAQHDPMRPTRLTIRMAPPKQSRAIDMSERTVKSIWPPVSSFSLLKIEPSLHCNTPAMVKLIKLISIRFQ